MRQCPILLLTLLLALLLALSPCALAQAQTDESAQTPQAGDEWTEPITGMEFVWVPGGCYEMGCGEWAGGDCGEDEYPPHEVCVYGFWMGKYEVTARQWNMVMLPARVPQLGADAMKPIQFVSWGYGQAFLERLNILHLYFYEFRYPSQAEWEYACRSGGQAVMQAGSDNVDEIAWHRSNSGEGSHFVGTKQPNTLGIYDMNGNLWEWTLDVYLPDQTFPDSNADPTYGVDSHSHIFRGGSWNTDMEYSNCLAWGETHHRANIIGFRVIRAR